VTVTTWERGIYLFSGPSRLLTTRTFGNGFLMLDYGRIGTLGLDLADEEIHEAILMLGDAGYVEGNGPNYNSGGGVHFTSFRVTGQGPAGARSMASLSRHRFAETLARLLETLADEAATEEESENMAEPRGMPAR
jgi:hypothetical protein